MDQQPSFWHRFLQRFPVKLQIIVIVGATLIATLGCLFLVRLTVTARATHGESQGLKLIDKLVHLPQASYQMMDLSLPCTGTLALDVSVAGEDRVNVFVV